MGQRVWTSVAEHPGGQPRQLGPRRLGGAVGRARVGADDDDSHACDVLVNWVIARGLFGTLYQGYRLIGLVRDEYFASFGVQLALGLLTALCTALLAPLAIRSSSRSR